MTARCNSNAAVADPGSASRQDGAAMQPQGFDVVHEVEVTKRIGCLEVHSRYLRGCLSAQITCSRVASNTEP